MCSLMPSATSLGLVTNTSSPTNFVTTFDINRFSQVSLETMNPIFSFVLVSVLPSSITTGSDVTLGQTATMSLNLAVAYDYATSVTMRLSVSKSVVLTQGTPILTNVTLATPVNTTDDATYFQWTYSELSSTSGSVQYPFTILFPSSNAALVNNGTVVLIFNC